MVGGSSKFDIDQGDLGKNLEKDPKKNLRHCHLKTRPIIQINISHHEFTSQLYTV